MRVVVLHNRVAENASADDRDVLVQVEAVSQSLAHLGHEPIPLSASLDLESLSRELCRAAPQLVFNLVESLAGSDRLMPVAATLLDVLGIPYTGTPADALALSSHKLLAKERLLAAGLPTPAWVTCPGAGSGPGMRPADRAADFSPPYIVKTIFEHASFGLDDDAVVLDEGQTPVAERLARQRALWQRPVFAEQFIPGRELNLSLLARNGDVEVLPPAEIDFSALAADRPRIVGYRAKWDEYSAEYRATPRTFVFPPEDAPLLAKVRELAAAAWRAFGLAGYARVDFRVDPQGRPWILEVNANPCLSPDAGFAAAVIQAGLSPHDAIARIVQAAC